MLKLVITKLVQGLVMILLVSAITFVLLSKAGGDAFSALLDNPQISTQTIERMRLSYGLDEPFYVRYANWLGGTLRGELGDSIALRVPVAGLIWSRFLNTFAMALLAIVFASLVALTLGLLSVRFRSNILDKIVHAIILISASTPRMVGALVALLVLLKFSLLTTNFAQIVAGSMVLSIPLISIFLAQIYAGLNEAMQLEFIQLARAKGLSESIVIVKHAMRAALNPFLTILGLSFGGLLGGSVIVESVLGWPGIGSLMVSAVRGRDVPLVMGIVLLASFAVWVGNTLADILQVLNDRRLRDD